MRLLLLASVFVFARIDAAQIASQAATPTPPADVSVVRANFHVRYISGNEVYIDGGRDAGLEEGTKLVLKQDPTKPADDPLNKAIEPGVIARLTVVSVASSSAVCEVKSTSRDIVPDDELSLPDTEVEKIVEKNTLGNTRQYPIVVSFSEGDPLDEEVREAIPRPALPEVNQIRGRIGFDVSAIQELGQNTITTTQYGLVFRADFTRILGTYWNLNGYWRGTIQKGAPGSQATMQDLMNRTYLMSLTYINPDSHWTGGVGRLYVPWASSLETIDGTYVGRQSDARVTVGMFAGSTPDPTAWDYNPQRKIGGLLVNLHGGEFEGFHYSTTAGGGVELLKWDIDRPFAFTENSFSYKQVFSLFHSMQIDHPTANPGEPALNWGLGQSLLSMRLQVHPRVVLDLTDTYFRDVPTYDPTLVGTGLLDKYLYQGVNGGARVKFPMSATGYFSVGSSNNSGDAKSSLNELFGATMSNIWKTGIEADARYSKFDSVFATGKYTTYTVSRDMLDNLRLNLQVGRYAYTSTQAANSSSNFVNFIFDSNLGAKLFLESMFTAQRGGTLDYNQWTTTIGYRFNNRAATRRSVNAIPH
jgi:hypothetical protein